MAVAAWYKRQLSLVALRQAHQLLLLLLAIQLLLCVVTRRQLLPYHLPLVLQAVLVLPVKLVPVLALGLQSGYHQAQAGRALLLHTALQPLSLRRWLRQLHQALLSVLDLQTAQVRQQRLRWQRRCRGLG